MDSEKIQDELRRIAGLCGPTARASLCLASNGELTAWCNPDKYSVPPIYAKGQHETPVDELIALEQAVRAYREKMNDLAPEVADAVRVLREKKLSSRDIDALLATH